MNKQQKITEYNKANKDYNITSIKKVNQSTIDYIEQNDPKSLDELYKSYSDIKRSTYRAILNDYKPEILGVNGNSMAYSVWLKAENGDTLHITRCNNYLVEVV